MDPDGRPRVSFQVRQWVSRLVARGAFPSEFRRKMAGTFASGPGRSHLFMGQCIQDVPLSRLDWIPLAVSVLTLPAKDPPQGTWAPHISQVSFSFHRSENAILSVSSLGTGNQMIYVSVLPLAFDPRGRDQAFPSAVRAGHLPLPEKL